MRLTFIEHPAFTEWVTEALADDELAAVQRQLQESAESGDVIRGCGGLRKLRCGIVSAGRGKRGGGRIVYMHIPEVSVVFLIAGYSKVNKSDLTSEQRKVLAALALEFKREIIQASQRKRT